jgi:hypothetical protein
MAELVHIAESLAPTRITGNTSATEITESTITWSELTTKGFANGDTCLLLVSYWQSTFHTTNWSVAEIRVGSSFASATILNTTKSISPIASSSADGGRSHFFMDKITLATNDNIYIGHYVNATTNSYLGDICIKLYKLNGDLTEVSGTSGDWAYAEDTSSGNGPTSPTTKATITLPTGAGAGDNWLILGCQSWLHDDTLFIAGRINDGSGRMNHRFRSNSTNTESTQGFVYPLSAATSGQTVSVDVWQDASGINDYIRSAIFALRMQAFADSDCFSHSTAGTARGTPVDTWVQTNTDTLNLSATGSVAWFAETIADYSDSDQAAYHRVQRDGTDIVSTLGNEAYRPRHADSESPLISMGIEASVPSGAKVYDVDCAEKRNVTTTYNYDHHALVAFSLELAGGGGGSIVPMVNNRQQQE